MIKNVNVYGLEESIRGAKFPMSTDVDSISTDLTNGIKALAQSGKGEGHDNWLNGVVVQFDLMATNKFWVEMERYHFIDFVSSQSTMHRITKFNLDEVYTEYVDSRIIDILKEKVREYNYIAENGNEQMKKTLPELYLQILHSNPAGFQLTARMTTNYRQLKTIYFQRKDHRLPEWREFCSWIETLPHAELIIGDPPKPMTNKEKIAQMTPDELVDQIRWLIGNFGPDWTQFRRDTVEWLQQEVNNDES